MKRREFIAALGGTAAWPMVALAQSERVRRIGVLIGADDTDMRACSGWSPIALTRRAGMKV